MWSKHQGVYAAGKGGGIKLGKEHMHNQDLSFILCYKLDCLGLNALILNI